MSQQFPPWFCVTLTSLWGSTHNTLTAWPHSQPSAEQDWREPRARAPLSRNHPWWRPPPWGISAPGTCLDGLALGSKLLAVIAPGPPPPDAEMQNAGATPSWPRPPKCENSLPREASRGAMDRPPRVTREQKPRVTRVAWGTCFLMSTLGNRFRKEMLLLRHN